ncbi:hypothetical protein BDDG_11873 [Blastomyces dermatitidis ATCC 18188]|uniref:Uncharacterized protein n=1 Tax=Ajellomyces dermatitidis (strain ATCC 18188 / CBS 674.68) TaxID=653446 RepID=A0A0J9EL17_AJEDA|nr:hypothetical protein BDDG_11873 [Blastomyces dermatitidis ATCC 18188]
MYYYCTGSSESPCICTLKPLLRHCATNFPLSTDQFPRTISRQQSPCLSNDTLEMTLAGQTLNPCSQKPGQNVDVEVLAQWLILTGGVYQPCQHLLLDGGSFPWPLLYAVN